MVKKKHVRFASMEEEDDNDEQEEDTLFDKRKDAGRGLKSALKAAKKATKPLSDDRVEVVGGGRRGNEARGRWMVTLTLCASFLGLVKIFLTFNSAQNIQYKWKCVSSFILFMNSN